MLETYSHAVGPNQFAAQSHLMGAMGHVGAIQIAERKTARKRIRASYLIERKW
jgi:hypothetical protein